MEFRAMVGEAVRKVASVLLAGFLVGLVVGGIGSRLAMRIMALTSDDFAQGRTTDAQATVGEITLEGTAFLILAGAFIGLVGGLIYLAIRRWLPFSGWRRGALYGVLLTVLAGPILLEPDGIDFIILSPAALAAAMFLAIPFLYGLSVVPLAERLENWLAEARSPIAYIVIGLGLLLLVPAFTIGIVVIVVSMLVFALRSRRGFERIWNGRSVQVLGAVLVLSLAAFGSIALIDDLTSIL